MVFHPIHYLPLIEKKINALDQAAAMDAHIPETLTSRHPEMAGAAEGLVFTWPLTHSLWSKYPTGGGGVKPHAFARTRRVVQRSRAPVLASKTKADAGLASIPNGSPG